MRLTEALLASDEILCDAMSLMTALMVRWDEGGMEVMEIGNFRESRDREREGRGVVAMMADGEQTGSGSGSGCRAELLAMFLYTSTFGSFREGWGVPTALRGVARSGMHPLGFSFAEGRDLRYGALHACNAR